MSAALILSFVWRFRWVFMAITLWLSYTAFIGWIGRIQDERDAALRQLSVATETNKENARDAERLRRQEEADRRTTAAELDATTKRSNTITVLKKEQRDAPDANDPAGPYFDDFADRLRQSRGTGP
jgi:hypothetical protein